MKNRWLREANGSCGDLGTFLPYVISAITVGGLSAVGVFFGFGIALISAGLFYGLPMAVQPMKAIAAALLTSGLTPSEIALAGMMVGALFLLLGLTGGIAWLARHIPRAVTLGLVLGLGLAMMWLGLGFILDAPWLGFGALAFVVLAMFVTRLPLLAIGVVAVLGASWWGGADLPAASLVLPAWVTLSWADVPRVLELAVLPQVPLTVANAIIVTAAVSTSLYPERAARINERRLSLSTGIGNLLLTPFGAMPMCHGAGGVVAQHRFGARTAMAPIMLGVVLLFTALFAGEAAAVLLESFPLPMAGALLMVAGADLAFSKRLFETRPDTWPVIGITAVVALIAGPGWALLVGVGLEAARRFIARRCGIV